MNKIMIIVLCGILGLTAACGDSPAAPTTSSTQTAPTAPPPVVFCHGTGDHLTSDQEQAKLKAYRAAGLGGQDAGDASTLEDPKFQAWSGC